MRTWNHNIILRLYVKIWYNSNDYIFISFFMKPKSNSKHPPITQDKFSETLNTIYEKTIGWMAGTQDSPAKKMADYYMKKNNNNPEKAAKALVTTQKVKTFSTGFVYSLGGIPALPVTLPADLTSALFIEIRMIAAVAIIGGYDPNSKEVRTLIFLCLIWGNIKKWLKWMWIKAGKETVKAIIKKMPAKMMIEINKKIWIRLFAKVGTKWAAGTTKWLPLVGWFIWGGMNAFFTDQVWKKAISMFVLNNLNELEEAEIQKEKLKKPISEQIADKAKFIEKKAQEYKKRIPNTFKVKKQQQKIKDPLADL